ncbi:MAG: 1-(5-phosphoribosyl)-5-[(5-phosphoribosylamino)methylideneamino]imidazole-4-carboxamide isomerase [Pelagibacteraceae bacterium TMED136]|nr:MAG: 1-(5-phosphoribosyl)-5-[(5-phosphoribosylamino)methylideneamino]imidazole-4-carboxamide isomerase [Pelagibacteraceae bacterium TMED136]|tara:strand:- start:5213 stop:5929 length:717 start_codon:yes stop_codon:yes gene_type:complete
MIIYPAIDLKDAKCVRLTKGDFNNETIYSRSPLEQAKVFEEKGFNYLHLIDLDRTIDKSKSNLSTIKTIIQNTNLRVQVGGGLRTKETIEEVIDLGVENIVMGTGAVNNLDLLLEVSQKYKNKISVGLDVREKMIALKGWKDQTQISCFDFLETIKNFPIRSIIFTDINKDGMKQGVNIKDTLKMAESSNIPVTASGGVSSIEDIKNIKEKKNIYGVVVGKAIYDGLINLNDLVKLDA